VRYTANINGDAFVEVGDREAAGRPPQRIFEMRLKRAPATSWPKDGTVPMR
jgi:hypothetical protein